MTAAAARPRPRPAAAQLEGHVQATADDAAAFRLPATAPWYDRVAVVTCENDTFCSHPKAASRLMSVVMMRCDARQHLLGLVLTTVRCIFRPRRRGAKHTHVIASRLHCIAEDDDDNSLLLHLPIPVHPVHDPLH